MVHFGISNYLLHVYAFFDVVNLFGSPPGIRVALVASMNTQHLINREFRLDPLAGLFISELLQITNMKCFHIHVQKLTGCFTSCSFCRNVVTGTLFQRCITLAIDSFLCASCQLLKKKYSVQFILSHSYNVNINLFRPVKMNSLKQHKL